MPAHRLDHAALDRAFAVAARRVEDDTVPFVILGVANAAGTIRLEAATALDATATPRIGPATVCLLASITKPIVATAVMRLVEEGRFPLAVPLAQWIPGLAANGHAPITAWHVLTHTTGLDDVSIERFMLDGGDRAGLLDRVLAQPQAAPPGSRFLYVTFTFELLAAAVERALDRPFSEILRETVLDPLGMADTTFDPRPDVRLAARMAPVAIGRWDGTRRIGSVEPDAASAMAAAYTDLRLAGGGLWSPAPDLLRFGRAMLRGGELDGTRILSPASVDLATREVTTGGLGAVGDRLVDEHYAIGWGKPGPASPASPASFGHGGKSGTRLWIDPAHDLVVVYLTASWDLPAAVMDETVGAVYAAVR